MKGLSRTGNLEQKKEACFGVGRNYTGIKGSSESKVH
jgi:hypothetical protein